MARLPPLDHSLLPTKLHPERASYCVYLPDRKREARGGVKSQLRFTQWFGSLGWGVREPFPGKNEATPAAPGDRDARTRGILVRANELQMMHLPHTRHLFSSEVGFPGPWLLGLLRVKNRKCSIDGERGATGLKSRSLKMACALGSLREDLRQPGHPS